MTHIISWYMKFIILKLTCKSFLCTRWSPELSKLNVIAGIRWHPRPDTGQQFWYFNLTSDADVFRFPNFCLSVISALLHVYSSQFLRCTTASYSQTIWKPRLPLLDSLLIQKDFLYVLALVSTSNRPFHINIHMITQPILQYALK